MILNIFILTLIILKDFYRDSKKVSNEKVKKELNYEFIYPSYKEGLAQ